MNDLSDYYSGGYFLIRADKPDWEQLKNGLLPEKLISLSTCLCPRLAIWWGRHPGDREAALQFGIPETKLDAFVEWCADANSNEIVHPSMFHSVDAARRFVEQLMPNTDGLHLVGIGLYQPLEAAGWNLSPEQMRLKRAMTVNLLLQPEGRDIESIGDQIDLHMSLETGGTPLGFEIVSFDYGNFGHSWICNGIHEDMHELFGIRPGQFGLIQTREEAQKACDWVMEDVGDGNHRGEPEPYAYWLLVSYPLTN